MQTKQENHPICKPVDCMVSTWYMVYKDKKPYTGMIHKKTNLFQIFVRNPHQTLPTRIFKVTFYVVAVTRSMSLFGVTSNTIHGQPLTVPLPTSSLCFIAWWLPKYLAFKVLLKEALITKYVYIQTLIYSSGSACLRSHICTDWAISIGITYIST